MSYVRELKKENGQEGKFVSNIFFLIGIGIIIISLIFLILWPPRGFFYDSEADIGRAIIVILGLASGLILMIWSRAEENHDEYTYSLLVEIVIFIATLVLFFLLIEVLVFILFFTEVFQT